MSLAIVLTSLRSRAIRIASVDTSGIRRIATHATSAKNQGGGFLANIYNGIEKFGQSLMKSTMNALGAALSFSWTKLWASIVSGGLFLMNFNWNITDKQLDDQIKQAEIGLAAARGRLAGQSLGYSICGMLPSLTIAVFNEPLGFSMMKELGEEASEEIAASLTQVVSLQLKIQAQRGFASLFKNYRTLLRGAAIGFAQVLVNNGVLTQESVDKANKNRNEPWTFAGAMDDSIESIKDPAEQAYAEEFWDEFQDSCIDAGFIIAGAADAYFAQQRLANQGFFGDDRVVEIDLNRDASV